MISGKIRASTITLDLSYTLSMDGNRVRPCFRLTYNHECDNCWVFTIFYGVESISDTVKHLAQLCALIKLTLI